MSVVSRGHSQKLQQLLLSLISPARARQGGRGGRSVSSLLKIISRPKHKMEKQKFDYFLVMDFEATCQEGSRIVPQEVIEFPCLLVSGSNLSLLDQFHTYVRPVRHPTLTPFCVQLTGINQDMVDDNKVFAEVQEEFLAWLTNKNLLTPPPSRFTFVTCGNWDLAQMLPHQCQHENLEPFTATLGTRQFVNIKYSFQQQTGTYAKGLPEMLRYFGLEFDGRLHSGIDDCRNILTVMKALADRGAILDNNAFISG